MATANAYRTQALGSLDEPLVVQRRGLPAPGATPGAMSLGVPVPPKPIMGMDYSGKFKTGPANYKPGRGIGVSQIMSQREGNVAARYADGTPVPRGMPINVAGYNTSGVGPGTRGYRGSGSIQGYSFENQGTAQTKGPTNYSPYFGGLNEFYRNQQTFNQFDQLQRNARNDQSDAIGSRMAQMAQFAAGRGDFDTAEAFSSALADRAAQRMAAQRGDVWSQTQSFPTVGAPSILPGSQAEINAFRPVGFAEEQTTVAEVDPNSWEVQAMLDAAAERQRRPLGPGETATRGSPGARSSFTNAQGSVGPGGVRTSYGGTQSGPDFFQQAADRQGTRNAFASPGPGYGGVPDSSQNIDEYGRLMAVRNKLRK